DASKDNSAASRKEQKRLEAEFRKLTAPLRKQIEKLDKQMEMLGEKLANAEAQLSDSSIYEADNKARLNEQMQLQASAKTELEDVEMAWMELHEQLEVMEAEFQAR
ncbi:ABC transporter ATP-binding protein, partial [Photobacterium ganghwense]|nr:ABC transporter ATP-binding protein [Photobacterium ganghwense]